MTDYITNRTALPPYMMMSLIHILLFAMYKELVNNRFSSIDIQICGFQNKIKRFNDRNVQFVFAPNLLQSKYLADFVFKDNTLYIISTSFSQISVAHE